MKNTIPAEAMTIATLLETRAALSDEHSYPDAECIVTEEDLAAIAAHDAEISAKYDAITKMLAWLGHSPCDRPSREDYNANQPWANDRGGFRCDETDDSCAPWAEPS